MEALELTAFSVVLGTLVLHGLTLKTLLRVLDLRDGDPVAAELGIARERLRAAVFEALPAGSGDAVELVRKEFKVRLARSSPAGRPPRSRPTRTRAAPPWARRVASC